MSSVGGMVIINPGPRSGKAAAGHFPGFHRASRRRVGRHGDPGDLRCSEDIVVAHLNAIKYWYTQWNPMIGCPNSWAILV